MSLEVAGHVYNVRTSVADFQQSCKTLRFVSKPRLHNYFRINCNSTVYTYVGVRAEMRVVDRNFNERERHEPLINPKTAYKPIFHLSNTHIQNLS
jgi:hypothetical protein